MCKAELEVKEYDEMSGAAIAIGPEFSEGCFHGDVDEIPIWDGSVDVEKGSHRELVMSGYNDASGGSMDIELRMRCSDVEMHDEHGNEVTCDDIR